MITLRKVFRQADQGDYSLLRVWTVKLITHSFCGFSQPNAFWHDFSKGASTVRFFREGRNIRGRWRTGATVRAFCRLERFSIHSPLGML